MTVSEWRQTMDRINSDPATAELRIEIEKACRRYLDHLGENGILATLEVVVEPGLGEAPSSNSSRDIDKATLAPLATVALGVAD